jgi:hypothetical protein
LTLAEIEAPIAQQLYELRSAAALEILFRQLSQAEAKRRRITVKELMQNEIEAKLHSPDAREVRRRYEMEPGESGSYEDFENNVLDSSRRGQRRVRQEEFFDEL